MLDSNTSEGSLHCNICCSPLSLCPPWVLQHTTAITQNSTRGSSKTSCLMNHWISVLPWRLSGSILFSAFPHWFRSGVHGRQLQEVNTDHPPSQVPLAPSREHHGVPGSDGRYNPSSMCLVCLRSCFWLHVLQTALEMPERHPGATW